MNVDFCIDGTIIETKRLILRKFNLNDLNDFYEYASIDGVGEKAGWRHHKTKEESKEILNLFINGNRNFAIYHKDDKKVIGSIELKKYNENLSLKDFENLIGGELGYLLNKNYWNKGIMTEVVNEIINYFFNEKKLDFLLATYYNTNQQSKRIQEKCGFKPYKTIIIKTRLNIEEESTVNFLLNPIKNIKLNIK